MWAAFHPLPPATGDTHPFFPSGVQQLTMFADYRVPQILHHLNILKYSDELTKTLRGHALLESGALEELCIRSASIMAVEAIRDEINTGGGVSTQISSVLIDFYLWDLAKRIETGEDAIEGIETQELLPAHRIRSIWY